MKQLVLATNNKHKVEELKVMLEGLPVEILTLDAFPGLSPVEEDVDTLEGNALKKAREIHRVTKLPALADDSGLEVGYLNGAPGVHTSRFAGENASYEDNWKKLLHDMLGVPARRRNARFRCVLAFVAPGTEQTVEGICAGRIVESSRGRNGFGYDPVFQPNGHSVTFAEMSDDLKNSLSHRGHATESMKPILHHYFSRS